MPSVPLVVIHCCYGNWRTVSIHLVRFDDFCQFIVFFSIISSALLIFLNLILGSARPLPSLSCCHSDVTCLVLSDDDVYLAVAVKKIVNIIGIKEVNLIMYYYSLLHPSLFLD